MAKKHKIINENTVDDSDTKRKKTCDDSDSDNDDDDSMHKCVYMKGNHIYFRNDVTLKSINKLIKLINKVNREYETLKSKHDKTFKIEPKHIYLHITSYGGNLFAGFMAYDAISRSKVPIDTIVEGYAMSAGSIMLMGGHIKYATQNSFVLIHQLRSYFMYGTFENFKDENINNELLMNKLKQIYLDNTKIKPKELDEIIIRELYLDVDYCLKYGIINKIYDTDL